MMELTPCEQKYDFLYTQDFASGILSVIEKTNSISGIYNMTSGKSIKIKDILYFLEEKIAPNNKLLKIGALPYRNNQVMQMQGNSDRFFQTFNFTPKYNIYEGLEETLKYYIKQKTNEYPY